MRVKLKANNRTIHAAACITSIAYGALYIIPVQHFFDLLLSFSLPVLIWLLLHYKSGYFLASADKRVFLIWAIIFKVILISIDPILEDDHFRYLWDGYTFAQYGNPYLLAPINLIQQYTISTNTLTPSAISVLNQVSYPSTKTVYGPILESVFLLQHWLSGFRLIGWQLIVFSLDIMCLFLIYPLVSKKLFFQISWLPLSILNFSINVHADLLAIFWALLSLHILRNTWRIKSQLCQTILLGTLLAFAVMSKIFALLLVPFFILLRPTAALSFGATTLIVYSYFLLTGGIDLQNIALLPTNWTFNSPFQYLLNTPFFALSKSIFAILFAIAYLIALAQFRQYKSIRHSEWWYFLFFLWGATLNSWYLVWLLLPLQLQGQLDSKPSLVWLTSTTFFLSYATGLGLDDTNLGLYEVAPWALLVQYGTVIVLVAYNTFFYIENASLKHRRKAV